MPSMAHEALSKVYHMQLYAGIDLHSNNSYLESAMRKKRTIAGRIFPAEAM